MLDVGCGLGDNAECFAAAGAKVTAFDFVAQAIEWAKRRFPQTQGRLSQSPISSRCRKNGAANSISCMNAIRCRRFRLPLIPQALGILRDLLAPERKTAHRRARARRGRRGFRPALAAAAVGLRDRESARSGAALHRKHCRDGECRPAALAGGVEEGGENVLRSMIDSPLSVSTRGSNTLHFLRRADFSSCAALKRTAAAHLSRSF